MPAKEFLKFLSDLANDSGVQQDMSNDPDGTMDKYGLDDAEKSVIRSKDAGQIGGLLGSHVDTEKKTGTLW